MSYPWSQKPAQEIGPQERDVAREIISCMMRATEAEVKNTIRGLMAQGQYGLALLWARRLDDLERNVFWEVKIGPK